MSQEGAVPRHPRRPTEKKREAAKTKRSLAGRTGISGRVAVKACGFCNLARCALFRVVISALIRVIAFALASSVCVWCLEMSILV